MIIQFRFLYIKKYFSEEIKRIVLKGDYVEKKYPNLLINNFFTQTTQFFPRVAFVSIFRRQKIILMTNKPCQVLKKKTF